MNNRRVECELERSGITVTPPERTRSSKSTVMPKIPTTHLTSIHRVRRSDNQIEEPKMVLNGHDEEEDSESIKHEDNKDKDKDKEEDVENENASDNKIAEEIDKEEDEDRSNDEVNDEIKEIEDEGNGIENENNGNNAGLSSFSFLSLNLLFSYFHATLFYILNHQ